MERHRIKVPTIGWVRFKEYGYVPCDAKVKSCTISQCADRYYISVLCDVECQGATTPKLDGIGVDLGIMEFAICSHNKVFENINKTLKVKKSGLLISHLYTVKWVVFSNNLELSVAC